ncbi:MAG: ATP-binding protein, partial [Calditrichaeota bacterium]|nr:ATP-binding protein [Calditrichota bacterium]
HDPNKNVTIRVRYEEDRVIVSVIDQGPGFDPKGVANPTAPQNLWKQNGRGIFLVKNLIDEVEIIPTGEGTEVVLTEYIPID